MVDVENVVRVFFRDRSWQVSVLREGNYLPTQEFGNNEELAVNYAVQIKRQYSPCYYEKLDMEGNLELHGYGGIRR